MGVAELALIMVGMAAETGCSGASVNVEHFQPPKAEMLHSHPLPDPYVFEVGGQWFIYGTSSTAADSFALRGPKLDPGALHEQSYAIQYPGHEDLAIWGFHPFQNTDGTYHAVGTVHLGGFRTEIAYFQPADPDPKAYPPSRWKFVRVLVSYVEGAVSAYESKIVRDGTDFYLLYCRSKGLGKDVSIVLHRMKSIGQLDAAAPPHVLLKPEGFRSEDRNPGYPLQLVEGPNLVKEGGKYILLYTVGDFAQRNYKVSFAYSDRLVPQAGQTYSRVLVDDEKQLWKSPAEKQGKEVHYLLQSEQKDWANYIGDQVIAPGLANLVQQNGQRYLVFHGYGPDAGVLDPRLRLVWRIPVRVNVDPKMPPQTWITLGESPKAGG